MACFVILGFEICEVAYPFKRFCVMSSGTWGSHNGCCLMVWCFMIPQILGLGFMEVWICWKNFWSSGSVTHHSSHGLGAFRTQTPLPPLCKSLMGSAGSTNQNISLTLRVVEMPLGLQASLSTSHQCHLLARSCLLDFGVCYPSSHYKVPGGSNTCHLCSYEPIAILVVAASPKSWFWVATLHVY